jgi:ketosteroid isomerase-like protein
MSLLCSLFLVGCGALVTEPPPARKTLSSAEVAQNAEAFNVITAANVDAWNVKDLNAIQAILTEDIRFIDVSGGDNLTGIDETVDMARSFCLYFPDLQRKTTDHFIGVEEGIAFYDYWGWKIGAINYTPENPFRYVFLLETREGFISTWRLFEGLAALEAHFITETESEAFQAVIHSYGSAWSSADPKLVAKLYAKDAVRRDSLFEENQQGNKAIKDFASLFFAWYPNAEWTSLEMFGESFMRDRAQAIGSSFAIQITTPADEACEVMAVVLLHVLDGKVVQEDLYYEPDSLIRCGWAQ